MSIEKKVASLVKLHEMLRESASKIKDQKKNYSNLKGEIGDFMNQEKVEVIEAGPLIVTCRDRKPPTTVSRKFLTSKLDEYFKGMNIELTFDLNEAIDFVFKSKPKPSKPYTLSIKKSKQKNAKKRKLNVEKIETPKHEEEAVVDLANI